MRRQYMFDEDRTSVLDYACGTGQISRELAPYARRIVGVDISQGMIDQFNKRLYEQGVPPEEMSAVRAQLRGVEGELEGERFDVVVVSILTK